MSDDDFLNELWKEKIEMAELRFEQFKAGIEADLMLAVFMGFATAFLIVWITWVGR
jgi:hypothetical protein